MATTLAEAIQTDRVSFEELHGRYDPVLQMVNVLIAAVPNCDRYLEVWQPGFRTYNLLVPNFLNLPGSLLGRSAAKDVVGLGMYTSSRAASCNCCSAHTCSFALRRGSSAGAVTGEDRTPLEAAAVAVAEALSYDQHSYTPALGDELRSHVSAGDAEWIVMGVAMMGFLNKFVDAHGVDLEPEAASESSSPTALPGKDSAKTIGTVLRNAPGAIRLDRQWMDHMPANGLVARTRLATEYDYDEELLSYMLHTKPRRALGAMLRHNLDPAQSKLGTGLKALGALVYANHVGNTWLTDRTEEFASNHGIDPAVIASVKSGVDLTDSAVEFDGRTAAVVAGALAMSPSPSVVDATTISTVTEDLTSEEIVELAVWISVSQLQHRLSLWYNM